MIASMASIMAKAVRKATNPRSQVGDVGTQPGKRSLRFWAHRTAAIIGLIVTRMET